MSIFLVEALGLGKTISVSERVPVLGEGEDVRKVIFMYS
jgi:hypothetical protein